jgi:hypothetical protein
MLGAADRVSVVAAYCLVLTVSSFVTNSILLLICNRILGRLPNRQRLPGGRCRVHIATPERTIR